MPPHPPLHAARNGPLCQNHCAFGSPLAVENAMSSELIKHVTDDSFADDVLQSDKPVLVDYWAEWCGPCKMIAPILDEAASQYGDRLQIAKMNVDENREIPAKFGIRGIPTLMLFKGGELAATKVGAMSKQQLAAFLDGHL
jgi:thioredoxin 1